jgi:phosphatidylserine/phosphatidylglycerophosphate/cardiolipin synthase-like enzyme
MDQIIQYLTDNFGQSFTNGTKKEIADLINALSREQIGELRYRLFNEARRLELTNGGQQALFWLQNCFDLIGQYKFSMHRVLFSPGTDILESISDLLSQSRETLDICVFTVTDERLASNILNCFQRGIKVRIITDDDKIYDHGSVIKDLRNAGVPVKIDHSRYHMHHKFGIIDSRIVFTGSFNWTYTASNHNQENLLITTNYDIVNQYAVQYNQLWNEMYWL